MAEKETKRAEAAEVPANPLRGRRRAVVTQLAHTPHTHGRVPEPVVVPVVVPERVVRPEPVVPPEPELVVVVLPEPELVVVVPPDPPVAGPLEGPCTRCELCGDSIGMAAAGAARKKTPRKAYSSGYLICLSIHEVQYRNTHQAQAHVHAQPRKIQMQPRVESSGCVRWVRRWWVRSCWVQSCWVRGLKVGVSGGAGKIGPRICAIRFVILDSVPTDRAVAPKAAGPSTAETVI